MYLISYDIASDKIRKKVANTLLNYGRRVQYSVFECDIDAKRCKLLYRELVLLTANMTDGSIRFYQISTEAYKKIVTIGNLSYNTEPLNEDVILI